MGAVYREELSANARKLIEQLLSLPQGWVTAAALAESIGVSRRTVLRELPAVEQWMQAAGAHFVRNPGKGLLLDEAPERRDALRTQLNSGDRKELSRAERRQQLLTRLLSEQESPAKQRYWHGRLAFRKARCLRTWMNLRPSYTPTGWRCSAAPAWGSGCRGMLLPTGGWCLPCCSIAGQVR